MERPDLKESDLHRVVQGMIQEFTKNADAPVETNADELVSVRMDSRYQVLSVSIRGIEIDAEYLSRLETAIALAVNDAIQEVVRINSERLNSLMPDFGEWEAAAAESETA